MGFLTMIIYDTGIFSVSFDDRVFDDGVLEEGILDDGVLDDGYF